MAGCLPRGKRLRAVVLLCTVLVVLVATYAAVGLVGHVVDGGHSTTRNRIISITKPMQRFVESALTATASAATGVGEGSLPSAVSEPGAGAAGAADLTGRRPTLSLKEALATLDWAAFEDYEKKNPGKRLPPALIEAYLSRIAPYVEMEPAVGIRVSERPFNFTLKCDDPRYVNVLTGKPRATPARIVDFVPFGYELDILELRLFELDGLVDEHVVAESVVTHRFARKPLVLSRNIERFARFRDRLKVMVLDDLDIQKFTANKLKHTDQGHDDWRIEQAIRKMVYAKWADAAPDLDEDTLLIHGDADEVPSGEQVFHLKHCEIKGTPIGFVGTHFRCNFDWAMPQNLGQPKVYRKRDIAAHGGFVRKLGDNSLNLAPGSYHLNRFGSFATMVYKHLSLAEGGSVPRDLSILKDPDSLRPIIARGEREAGPDPPGHIVNPKIPLDKLPWVAAHNRERYAYMFPARTGNPWS